MLQNLAVPLPRIWAGYAPDTKTTYNVSNYTVHFCLIVNTEYSGREYIIVKNYEKSWNAARLDCQQRGSLYNLVSIKSEQELEFLKAYA